MRKYLLFLVLVITIVSVSSCSKEKLDSNYNAKIRVDSIKQDTFVLANQYVVYKKVKVFYTVLNNDNVVLNCYRYTINAMDSDSLLYQLVESHYNTVKPNSEIHDSTKIGIGNNKIAWTSINNTLFQ